MKSVKNYFQEAIHELRQVQWPTKNQTIRISVITIIFVFASAILIGLLDLLLGDLFFLIR